MEGNIYARLSYVQSNLNVPKGQFNSFGNFHYRSCEDILTAVKPLLNEAELSLTLSDEPVVFDGWHYIKASALLRHGEELIIASAYAREPKEKKGSDESQLSGMASSYARKYALSGLLLLDDVKDSDTQQHQPQQQGKPRYDKRKSQAKGNEQADAKNRCWRAVKKFAAANGLDAKEVFGEIPNRNGFDDSPGFWTAVAVEFETA